MARPYPVKNRREQLVRYAQHDLDVLLGQFYATYDLTTSERLWLLTDVSNKIVSDCVRAERKKPKEKKS